MELSEDERNELMKKESSRLLKTGHRVSYSPRKEKALKIYLDGGPAKDSGQDWVTSVSSGCWSKATQLWDSVLSVRTENDFNIKQRVEADMLSSSTLSPRTDSQTLLCTIVYCIVKFKGNFKSCSIQKKNQILYRQINPTLSSRDGGRYVRSVKLGWKASILSIQVSRLLQHLFAPCPRVFIFLLLSVFRIPLWSFFKFFMCSQLLNTTQSEKYFFSYMAHLSRWGKPHLSATLGSLRSNKKQKLCKGDMISLPLMLLYCQSPVLLWVVFTLCSLCFIGALPLLYHFH